MAIQGRYQFVKKVYPNYLVIIASNKNKRGYTSCGIDFREPELKHNIFTINDLKKEDLKKQFFFDTIKL